MNIPENIKVILDDLRGGHCVLVTDSHERENEADLLMAAEFISVEKINFFLNHARGLITTPLSESVATRLNLPLMVLENTDNLQTAFTISIDAKEGIHSGISSHDRMITIKKLADPQATSRDFTRPGHVFPLIAKKEGVLKRGGHTEAAIDLMKLANLYPVAVLCETLNTEGNTIKGEELLAFAKMFKLKMIAISELQTFFQGLEKLCK